LESAGADALELNIFFLPSDFTMNGQEIEAKYYEIIKKVKGEISIPLALKISHYFSNLGQMIHNLSNTGISGLVLFNRFFSPDFEINKFKVLPTHVLSTPSDLPNSLRWIAIMSERVSCDLVASTGIHDGEAVIKQLLAGANAVQVVSSLYKNGKDHLRVMIKTLEKWMHGKGFTGIEQFRGKMSQAKSSNPVAYERVQFMKYFGS
jgi:dihydroorotate dehydrogenase (fumarate)